MLTSPLQNGHGTSTPFSVSRFAASLFPNMANLMSSMYNPPLYVRYGLKHRIKLLGDYGVSEAFKSVHPGGNPMSHSTHVGFSWPPLP